jgi:integrase
MELSELNKRYAIELGLMPLSEITKENYKSVKNKFLSENERVYRMSELDLKRYFSGFRERYSDSYYNVICSAAKILYERVLKQPNKMNWFVPIKSEKKFHQVMTYEEFVSVMKSISNLKHKTFTILLFSTGIRISELLNIKLSQVDLIHDKIFIHTLKHGINRDVQIHEVAKKYILAYLKRFNPKEYLFENPNGGQYSETSIRNVLHEAETQIGRKITPHSFRHQYITKLVDNASLPKTMQMTGHRSIKSILHYYHNQDISQVYNPLDDKSRQSVYSPM